MTEATTPTRPAHTPGPWAAHYDHPDRTTIAYIRSASGTMADEIAVCYAVSSDVERANARLIAAAPELLEALRGVIRVADRATVEFDAARAAIARATGAAS